jgi:CBS domain-containing protein
MDPADDKSERLEMARMRQQLAGRLILFSFGLIAALLVALAVIALVAWQMNAADSSWAVELQKMLNSVLTAVLPLLGAWVGAIIAFYFGRENYEAAAQNVQRVIQGGPGEDLKSIAAQDIMIRDKSLTFVTTPGDDTKSLDAEILPQFTKKNLGRIVILNDANTGLGVIHDGALQRFLLSKARADVDIEKVTLRELLTDSTHSTLIKSSVIYVSPTTTLAEVKQRMEDASKGRETSVRDAFVTTTGLNTEKVLGYVTDVDIAKKGAFK